MHYSLYIQIIKCVLLSIWLVGCRVKDNCPLMGPGSVRGMLYVRIFLRDPSPYLRKFRRKTTENSERLGRQARPRIEHGTSRLSVQTQNHSATGGACYRQNMHLIELKFIVDIINHCHLYYIALDECRLYSFIEITKIVLASKQWTRLSLSFVRILYHILCWF